MASSVHRDPKLALADTRGLTLSARPCCAGHNRVAVCFHRKQDTDGPWPTTVWLTIFHSTEVCKRWTFIGSALCTLILVISQASDMRTVPSRECWAAAARAAPGQPRDYAGKRPTPHIPSRVTAGSAPLRLLLMVGMGRGAVTTAFAFPGLQSCRPAELSELRRSVGAFATSDVFNLGWVYRDVSPLSIHVLLLAILE